MLTGGHSARFAEVIMVIIMDMSAGRIESVDQAAYSDEVLDAGWLPQPDLALQVQECSAETVARILPPEDIDAFLAAIYRYQA